MQGPPHSCDDHVKNMTREELEMLRRWEKLSIEQAAGERRRPDLPLRNGEYLPSFYCALLQSIRPENVRTEDTLNTSFCDLPNLSGSREYSSDDDSEAESVTEESDGQSNSTLSSPRMEPDLLEDLDLQALQNVKPCTAGLPHQLETDQEDENFLEDMEVEGLHHRLKNRHILSVGLCEAHTRECYDIFTSYTAEEYRQYRLWERWSGGQKDLQGELVYPCESGENYPHAFYCAALREVRKFIHDDPDQDMQQYELTGSPGHGPLHD